MASMTKNFIARVRSQAASARSKWFRDYVRAMPRPLRIIDLGGSVEMWQRWGAVPEDGLDITLLNHHALDTSHRDEPVVFDFLRKETCDALKLTPQDLAAYDLIFSNSMLEHLPTRDAQRKLANIIVNSGRPYFVQVPNKNSPVDPHFPHPAVPFFAIYPRALQARLYAVSALGSRCRASSTQAALDELAFYNPLGASDMRKLFPNADLGIQWTSALPMSIIVRRSIA